MLSTSRNAVVLGRRNPDGEVIALLAGGIAAGGIEGALWNLSDLTTVFSDRAGTAPAAVDGVVGMIKDKGPNARHLIADSDATRGTLRFVNGIYYVESDGVSSKYNTGTLSSTTWLTYLSMAAKRPSTSGWGMGKVMSLTDYVKLNCLNAFATNISRNGAAAATTTNAPASSWPADTFKIADVVSKVGLNSVGVNGAAYTTAVNLLVEQAATGQYRLFANEANSGGSAYAVQGSFAGGFAANMEPSAAQRAIIVTRLGQLVGLTL